MSGFDPKNDIFDRRVFFEVTGKSLVPGEYLPNDSSSEEEEEKEQKEVPDDPFDLLLS